MYPFFSGGETTSKTMEVKLMVLKDYIRMDQLDNRLLQFWTESP